MADLLKAIKQDPGLDLEQGYVFMCHSVHENIHYIKY